jgi:hypothetical protein
MGASYSIVERIVNARRIHGEGTMPVLIKLFGFVLILLAIMIWGFYIFGIYDVQ